MENSQHKSIWQTPWGFAESQLIVWGLVLVGFLLNISLGNFDFYLISRPYNFVLGGSIMLFMLLSFLGRNKTFFKFFSSLEFSISLLIALTVLAIIMGLTKQGIHGESLANLQNSNSNSNSNIFVRLGFNQMTSSWSFVLIYFLFILSLGALVVRRIVSKKKKNIIFLLLHAGLWIVLFFAGLGYVDTERYIIYVNKDEIEWRVYGSDGEKIELPIAIKLNDFILEEYIPKLAIIERKTGQVQPSNNPEYIQIDTNKQRKKILSGFEIVVENYIHEAVRSSDTSYRHMPMLASTPAVYVTVKKAISKTNSSLPEEKEKIIRGWVSAGNIAQIAKPLVVDSNYALVMTPAEPKSFISDVEIYTQDEKHKEARIEVNSPVEIGSWMIYQHSYDDVAGKMSNYSAFELVYDPWLYYVYIGIGMIALGALLLVILGKY